MNIFGKKNPNTKELEQISENIKGTFAQVSRGLEENKNLEKTRIEEIKKLKEEMNLIKTENSKTVSLINEWTQETSEVLNKLVTENKLIIRRLADAQSLIITKCGWKKEYKQEHLRAEQTFVDILTELNAPKQIAPKSRLIEPSKEE